MDLSSEDIDYLNSHYPSLWKKVSEDVSKYGLLIQDFPLPNGYMVKQSTLMLLIPSGYPGSALDMFYFSPPLKKSDGSSLEAVEAETHFKKEWQRWSRHYKWNPGFDSIITHIEYIQNQLEKELKK